MSTIHQLITKHIDIWTEAGNTKKSGRGRSSANGDGVYGIKKLRELILELAVRGKLVPQDANDEPASELLKCIQAEKEKLITDGKINKDRQNSPITDEEKPYRLPHGWEWVRLGNTGKIFNGNSINENEKLEKYTNLKNGYPFIATKDVGYGRTKLDYQNGVLIPFENESFKIAHKGAILICSEGGSAGKKIGMTDMDVCFGNKLYANEVFTGFISKFIFYVYQAPYFFEFFSKRMTGIIGGISRSEFLTIPCPIPSENEQQRIVAKVDELMALCDQMEAQHNNATEVHEKLVNHLLGTLTQSKSAEEFGDNWQRIAAHFDTLFTTEASIDALKQTLLQLAVMGKLVPQDPRDEPASELLKRIQDAKAKLVAEGNIKKDKQIPRIADNDKILELPMGWERIYFGEIITLISGQHLKLGEYFEKPTNNSIPYITGPADFGDEGPVPTRHTCERRALSICGDVLVTVKGSGVGKTNTVFQKELAISRQLMSVRPLLVNINFIEKLLITLAELFQRLTVGIAIPGISREDVLYAVIEIPPLAEQHRIVAKVDELMAICDHLKTQLTQANQLKQKLADVIVERAAA